MLLLTIFVFLYIVTINYAIFTNIIIMIIIILKHYYT